MQVQLPVGHRAQVLQARVRPPVEARQLVDEQPVVHQVLDGQPVDHLVQVLDGEPVDEQLVAQVLELVLDGEQVDEEPVAQVCGELTWQPKYRSLLG